MAQDESRSQANIPVDAQQKKSSVSVAVIGFVIGALIIGAVGGYFASNFIHAPQSSSGFAGKTTLAESELDTVMGTYTFEGERIPVTVREAILETSSLETAKNSDGTYDVPSVDTVLAIARNHVLTVDAQDRGLTASEEDAKAYAKETLGTDDYAQIAAGYGMSVEQVGELMLRSALIGKLRDVVVTTPAMVEPAAPETPADGKEDDPQPQYARYILDLVGDEWNPNANSWARNDGPYREKLKDYTISNEAATYSAAQAAYFVAYAQYSQTQQQVSSEWTAYVNESLVNVPMELVTLVA